METSLARLAEVVTAGGAPESVGAAATSQSRAVAYFTALGRQIAPRSENCWPTLAISSDRCRRSRMPMLMKAADIFTQLVKKVEIKQVLRDGDEVCVFWDYHDRAEHPDHSHCGVLKLIRTRLSTSIFTSIPLRSWRQWSAERRQGARPSAGIERAPTI
jgi:hypothetical protein